MSILLKKVKVVDKNSAYHGKEVDILIRRGNIEAIGKNIKADGVKTFEEKGACISPGWLDIGTQIGEPGYEFREDLESVSNAALSGGFTALAPFPNSNPVVDGKSNILFLINTSKALNIDLYPIGALTKGCEGKEMAEMLDMHHHGAVAFSDGSQSLQNGGLMLRCLQYASGVDGIVIDRCTDNSLSKGGQVNEGISSMMMGVKGIPALAEHLSVGRNLALSEYANARILVHQVSTRESLVKIKKSGQKPYASVSALNLSLSEEDVMNFDANLKVDPPLRKDEDIQALVKGIQDGLVQVICSNHVPLEEEAKVVSFESAENGALGLQTAFALLATYCLPKISIQRIVECLCHNPREILGIPPSIISKGNSADLTLFHPKKEWVFDPERNLSKSKNSSFFSETFSGCVLAAFKGGHEHWNILK